MANVDLDKIQIDGRARRDMGDLESLAESIRQNGVLSPVLLTPDLHLVCGERRVRAARMAGLTRIPAQISGRFDDARKALEAERDENTCRKDMIPSELLALGERLSVMYAKENAQRKAEGQRRGGEVFAGREASSSVEEEASPTDRSGWTDIAVAEAMGVNRATYGRIKTIAKATQSHDPHVAEIAREASAAMDKGQITVSKADDMVRQAKKAAKKDPIPMPATATQPVETRDERAEKVAEMAKEGYDRQSIATTIGIGVPAVVKIANDYGITIRADAVTLKRKRADSQELLDRSVDMVEVAALGLDRIRADELTNPEAREQIDSLIQSTNAIRKAANRIKESL